MSDRGPVERVVATISRAWEERNAEDRAASQTFNNMFGDVERLVAGVDAELSKKLPELQPQISLDQLSLDKAGCSRNLRLKSSKKSEEIIPLRITFGQTDVIVGPETVSPAKGPLNVVSQRIIGYFLPKVRGDA